MKDNPRHRLLVGSFWFPTNPETGKPCFWYSEVERDTSCTCLVDHMQAQLNNPGDAPNNGLCEPLENTEFLKRGLLYKRRNGFGKHMPTAWVYRYFTLTHTGVMSYYETPYDSHSAEEIKPRGRVHLGMIPFGKSISVLPPCCVLHIK